MNERIGLFALLLVLIWVAGIVLFYARERLRREVLFLLGAVYLISIVGLFAYIWLDAGPGIPIVFTLVSGVMVYSLLAEHVRTAARRTAAQKLGLTFSTLPHLVGRLGEGAQMPLELPSPQLGFVRSRGGHIRDVSQGHYQGARVAVYDCVYRFGTTRSRHERSQTVVCFELERPVSPPFTLQPRYSWILNVLWRFGRPGPEYQEVVLENAPALAKKYRLWSVDPQGVRALFDARLIEFFETRPKLAVENRQDRLLVYRLRVRTRSARLKKALEEGHQVFTRLSSAARHIRD